MKILLTFFLCINFLVFANDIQNKKCKILIGSYLNQKPNILNEFLKSLQLLEKESFIEDYYFIDDMNCEESTQLLNNFENKIETKCSIILTNNVDQESITNFKNQMIKKAMEDNYDYLFLIDSNVLLHTKSIDKLISSKKDIISNVFWANDTNNLSNQDVNYDFFNMLKKPGTYEVESLEECILISKTALKKGVSFKRISNLTVCGKDRHFCIRAEALGLSLYIDTHFPAYQIKNEKDFENIENFKKKYSENTHRLTLSMIVKNEAKRYLRQALEKAKEYITDAVIIDDGSTDSSAEICLEVLQGIPLHLIINNTSKFSNEISLRKQQWEETIKTNPEWILFLDADEIFEDRFKEKINELINTQGIDVYLFRLFDFWDENHYRDERFWLAAHRYNTFLLKYNPKFNYQWNETPQHCGRLPKNILSLKKGYSDLRLKHLGWAKYDDRVAKYLRYKKLDPDAKFGCKGQYDSILSLNPNLIEWKE